jgi:hypothetical protein
MSVCKPVNEAAAPRTEEKGPGKNFILSLRNELPEIKHNSWMEWDDIMLALKEFCHFQDLESIIQDPFRRIHQILYAYPSTRRTF